MEKVGAVKSFPAHEMTGVDLGGKQLLVVNDGENLYVTARRCPHLHGNLAEGSLEGTIITCPLHGSQFDAKTGKVMQWTNYTGARLAAVKVLRPPKDLKTYRTLIRDGMLYLEDSDE